MIHHYNLSLSENHRNISQGVPTHGVQPAMADKIWQSRSWYADQEETSNRSLLRYRRVLKGSLQT